MLPVRETGRDEENMVLSNTGRARTPPTGLLGGAQGDGGFDKGVLMMGKKRTGSMSTSSSGSSKVSGLSMKSR